MDFVLHWISQYGYIGIFALLMFGIAGLPIPDETLMMATGYLIHSGRLSLTFAFAGAVSGSICGITLSYIIGRTVGCPLVERYGRYVHLSPERLKHVEGWFDKVGDWLLTIGYFVPAVRHFTALVAGISRMPYPRFAVFAYLGAFIWVSTFLTIGYFVGEDWQAALEWIHKFTWATILICVAIGVLVWFVRRRIRGRSSNHRA